MAAQLRLATLPWMEWGCPERWVFLIASPKGDFSVNIRSRQRWSKKVCEKCVFACASWTAGGGEYGGGGRLNRLH